MARDAVHGAMTVDGPADPGRAHDPKAVAARSAPDRLDHDPTAVAGPAIVHRAHDPKAVAARSAPDRLDHDPDIGRPGHHGWGRRRIHADPSNRRSVPMIGDATRARAPSLRCSPAMGIARATRSTVDSRRADSRRVGAPNHTAMTSPTARSVGRFPGGIDRAVDRRSHRLRPLVMARSWWPDAAR